MQKNISLGTDIFDKFLLNDGYVDKTEIIYKLVKETKNEISLGC